MNYKHLVTYREHTPALHCYLLNNTTDKMLMISIQFHLELPGLVISSVSDGAQEWYDSTYNNIEFVSLYVLDKTVKYETLFTIETNGLTVSSVYHNFSFGIYYRRFDRRLVFNCKGMCFPKHTVYNLQQYKELRFGWT